MPWQTVWPFPIKSHTQLPYDPSISIPDISPREMKHLSLKDLFTNVYGSLIHNGPNQETTWMPIDRWIHKWWWSLTMKYYRGIRRKELHRQQYQQSSSALCWGKKKKRSDTKVLHSMIPFIWWSGKGETIDIIQMNGCQGMEWKQGINYKGDRRTSWDNGNTLLQMLAVVTWSWMSTYTKHSV